MDLPVAKQNKTTLYFRYLWLALLVFMPLLKSCQRTEVVFRVGSVFSSGMVLQQQSTVPVWGRATTGLEVRVDASWSERSYQAEADDFGQWQVRVPTPNAGGPFTMTIEAADTSIIIDDILIGEVWLWAGPESPAMTDSIFDGDGSSPVRFFVPQGDAHASPQYFVKGSWKNNASLNPAMKRFAQALARSLKLPVGLIDARLKATSLESWLSPGQMESFPEAEKQLRDLSTALRAWHDRTNDPALLEKIGVNVSTPPAVAYNGLIRPVARFGIRGAVLNPFVTNLTNPEDYARLLPGLIADWRRQWLGGKFHFLYAQAPPMAADSSWDLPRLREAQMQAQWLNKTAMIVMTDMPGGAKAGLPKYYAEAGNRFAQVALQATKKTTSRSGKAPWYKEHRVEGNSIVVQFHQLPDGFRRPDGPLRGFTIAGEDMNFKPARAIIEGNSIRVSSGKVDRPKAVRFAWSDSPKPNLFSRDGLAVSPFRTDDDHSDFVLETDD